jgi:hypothetical protein
LLVQEVAKEAIGTNLLIDDSAFRDLLGSATG